MAQRRKKLIMIKNYDVCIIGGGPAGLSAAIYVGRSGNSVCVLEKLAAGGQVNTTPEVANYPGFSKISGWELSMQMAEQASNCGAERLSLMATKITKTDGGALVECDGGEVIACRALILAMGAAVKSLGLEGEKELTGAGVSYCATCDGAFFKGKDVMVAGGGKLAMADVMYLAPIVKNLYWVNSGEISANAVDNVIKLENTVITGLVGNPLNAVKVKRQDGDKIIDVSGLFVAVGYTPASFLARGLVNLDEKGYIITDDKMFTGVSGIYAVGDVRQKEFRQIVTAASDGAIAAHYINKAFKK